jgi:hypothetical protein
MCKHLLITLLLLVPLRGAGPQARPVNVRVRVLLVDKDLNQKAVPFYIVNFRKDGNGNALAELKTDLDGKAEKQLAPGHYSITTIWKSKSTVQSSASISRTTMLRRKTRLRALPRPGRISLRPARPVGI